MVLVYVYLSPASSHSVATQLCPQGTVALYKSPTSGSYILSIPASEMIYEPWEEECDTHLP